MTTIIENKISDISPEENEGFRDFVSFYGGDGLGPRTQISGLKGGFFDTKNKGEHIENIILEDVKNLASHMNSCVPCNKIQHQARVYLEVIHSLVTPRFITAAAIVIALIFGVSSLF